MLTWDRDHDWVLQRFFHDLTAVTIRLRRVPPSAAELAAVRRCLPRFRDLPPAAVRAAFGDDGVLRLGRMPSPEARRVVESARARGLEVAAEEASCVGYLPVDRTSGCAWLIEDEAEAAAVVRAMLDAGVPVQEVEA